MNVDVIERRAVISPCGLYRYHLSRSWARDAHLLWVMLNPSTADRETDDQTVRTCMAFARTHRFGGIEVVNLFGLRATDPLQLDRVTDPVGPENDRWVTAAVLAAVDAGADVVAAWGAHPIAIKRSAEVLAMIRDAGARPMCMGRTRSGAPRHPLYLPAARRMEVF